MKKNVLIAAIAVMALAGCKKTDESAEVKATPATKSQQAATSATVFNVTPSTNLNSTFWSNVQTALQSGPVDVIFAEGTYTRTSTLTLTNIGHSTNRLNLKTAAAGDYAVFNGSIAKLIGLTNCRNIYILRFKFTGNVTGYAMTISQSNDIHVAYSEFVDLPQVYYGALGVNTDSDNIFVKYNKFLRVGVGTTAHMVYGAYHVTRLKIVQNTFTDCSGSFVRFRGDVTTQGVVYDNTFKSNGTYNGGANPIFIEVPVFNDVNPGDERFGTRFMITKNTFTYSTSGSQSTRYALVFHHSGYNPPDRTHLISASTASTLGSGTVTQRRSIMSSHFGLNGAEIRYGGNTITNVQNNVSYRCQGGYGAVAPWTGVVSIGVAVNASGLATTEAEALAFYDDLH